MQQLRLIDAVQKPDFSLRYIPALGRRGSDLRIARKFYYVAYCRVTANAHIDAILARGNAAQQKNVAGRFIITELVLQ